MSFQRTQSLNFTLISFSSARISIWKFVLFVFLMCWKIGSLKAQPTSISDYNQQRQTAKKIEYEKFKNEWFKFLKNETKTMPKINSAAWARSATEEFLIASGGLKARLALASQNNQYAITFTRPIEEDLRRAGFHRTRRSLFMDINQMTSNEWLVVFVHEVAHSLDSELVDSLEIYNDASYIEVLTQFGLKSKSLSELDFSERQKLDSWLLAGLNRGFLAEYRAWLLTYLVYEEGLRDGTLIEVNWLETLKDSKPSGVKTSDYILRFLSPSWKDPRHGLFAFEFIQNALLELRKRIDDNPESVKLGKIGRLIFENN